LLFACLLYMQKAMLEKVDRHILRHLQRDPGMGGPALAEAVRLTPARVSRRLDRLRETGVLKGSRRVIDWRALGYAVEVSLRITLDKTQSGSFDAFLSAARQVPEVTEIQTFLGRVDVRLSLVARDLPDYQRVYRDAVLTLPHIADIEALMTVATVKTGQGLPI